MAQEADLSPMTLEEINARLDKAERDIDEGRYYTTEEVFRHMNQRVAAKLLKLSAEEGITEIERGEYYSNEEVLERMNERLESIGN